jgi:hypothetical protein
VLLAGAGARSRPGLVEAADLVANALWMRLRPHRPGPARTAVAAVRLMYVGAVVELGTLITVVATLGTLRSAITHRSPGYTAVQWHAEESARLIPLEVAAAIAVMVWLCLAWANGRGWRWARWVFAAFFATTTVSLINGIAQHAATYARADLVAGAILWLVSLATVVLLFARRRRSSSSSPRIQAQTGAAPSMS